MWLYGQVSLNISHHLTKFGGHRHSGRGSKKALCYHVILEDHVIKDSYVWPYFDGDMMFLVVESQDSTCLNLNLVKNMIVVFT